MSKKPVLVVGAGLAGSEAAWQIASQGIPVVLTEMRSAKQTPAHQTDHFAELVCSNSFRSDDWQFNAVGLLHEEMRRMNSLIMKVAHEHSVPAGGALAVDRDGFSGAVTKILSEHPLITVQREELSALPQDPDQLTLIATGPLTSGPLAEDICRVTGQESLAFFDAIAPIIYKESIDFSKAWYQSRYDKAGPAGTGRDYINCPMNKQQYENFIDAVLAGEKTEFKEWEGTPYFEGCLPIEVMAERGKETLRFGPMKPVGLFNPHSEEQPYAVVQLRQDNALGTLYNLVGFQTKLKYAAQKEIFTQITGLENAEFARLGGIHRNTFIKSPRLLDSTLRLKSHPFLRFAGQMTGCEGYVESASVGLMAGRFIANEYRGESVSIPPAETAMGSLLGHITGGASAETFQPMNINYGLFPPLPEQRLDRRGKPIKLGKREKAQMMSERALSALDEWLKPEKVASVA